MIPWIQHGVAAIPGGGGDLKLAQRGTEFSIRLGQIELMNSRLSGSEEALATLTCDRLMACPDPHILIGGLGMGFTLAAALATLPDTARITVAELVPGVIEWARGPMQALFGQTLSDPRVSLHCGDVAALIRISANRYDAILLDVDNGPDALTHRGNDRLYDTGGIAAAYHALRAGGILAVWSAGPDPRFAKRLQNGGFTVDEVTVRANKGRNGARHIIWLARRGV